MAEKLGIKNLVEVVDFGLAVADAVYHRDVAHLAPVLSSALPAFQDVAQIPAEFVDIDQAEAEQILAHVMAKYSIGSEKAVLVVTKGIKTAVAVFDLVKALRS